MRGKKPTQPGLTPGTLEYNGDVSNRLETTIQMIDYNEEHFHESTIERLAECQSFHSSNSVTWIDVDGVHHVEEIQKIGDFIGLHPLLLEDIVNTEQRPKIEDFDKYIFLVVKMLDYDRTKSAITVEHISMVLGPHTLVTFQDKQKGDVFNPVRDRLKISKGRIRKQKSDYLLYALLDVIVDNYFSILEILGDKIETLEQEVMTSPTPATLRQIYRLKREIMALRKHIWPVREVINNIQRSESDLFQDSTNIFYRDVYEHTVQIMDQIEYFREMLTGMMDIYLSSLSYRMNAVMKVLTVISTIFMPLTFVTSIYGMNFEFMPELHWKYGYAFIWGIMISISLVMLFYFRKKRWF